MSENEDYEVLIKKIIEAAGKKTTVTKIKDVLLISAMSVTLIAAIAGWAKPISVFMLRVTNIERENEKISARVATVEDKVEKLLNVPERLHKVESVLWEAYPGYHLFLTDPDNSRSAKLPQFDNRRLPQKDKNKQ